MEDGLAEKEQEFQHLLEQLRNAQTDRQHYVDELLRRTRQMEIEIASLEGERSDLVALLNNANSLPNQRKDNRHCEDLANLADNKEWLEQQIEEEKGKQTELDGQIREITRKLLQNQRDGGTGEGIKSQYVKNAKRITTLHGRLQNSLKHYNELLAQNARLREEIDTLRCERIRYDQIYKKLDIELTKMRQETANLIHEATVSYHQREECNAKMQTLKEKTDRDMAAHNVEMKELVRAIDYERKLKAFMDTKAREREEDPQFTAYKARKCREAEEKRADEENTIEAYTTAFNHIFELTGMSNLSYVVPTFQEREDRNFALYVYLNELFSEYDTIKMDVFQMREDSRSLSNKCAPDMNQISRELSQTANELQAMDERKHVNIAMDDSSRATFQQATERMKTLFSALQCENKELTSKLAASTDINQDNALDYLQAIEKQANRLLTVLNYVVETDTAVNHPQILPLTGATLKKPQEVLGFLPSSLTDDYQIEEVDQDFLLPFTRNELASKVMHIVQKKEKEVREQPFSGVRIE